MRSALPTDATPLPEAALAYGAAGLRVFPLTGKLPLTGRGFYDATADLRQITRCWKTWPDANIGWCLPVGIVVVDVDPRHGGDQSLLDLGGQHGPFPPTLEAVTGGGGIHLVFRVPDETRARQLTAWRPGIDTRVGGKGYIVLPPSLHDSGRRYRWRTNLSPASAPTWMVQELRPPAPAPTVPYTPPASPAAVTRRHSYALAVLVGEAKEVANTPEGARNARLNKAWWRCAQFRDVLDREVAERELTAAAVAAGLPAAEIQKVLR